MKRGELQSARKSPEQGARGLAGFTFMAVGLFSMTKDFVTSGSDESPSRVSVKELKDYSD